MSEETTKDKIKLPAKPLTRNQKWNVFVRFLPWGIILGFVIYFAGTYVGHYQTVNSYEREATIKAEAVQSVSKASE